jgi:hypothetical protein
MAFFPLIFPSTSITPYGLSYDHIVITKFFENLPTFSKDERWKELIAQGTEALEAAKKLSRVSDEAKICSHLASICYYMGNYRQACTYAICCHELADKCDDPTLLARMCYLESAIRRALAAKEETVEEQQTSYADAVAICEQGAAIYSKLENEDGNLEGEIYFNLAAAHADNPKGDLKEAKRFYNLAAICFKDANITEGSIRTAIDLGKVYLLQRNFDGCEQKIKEVKALIAGKKSPKACNRLSMQANYLDAQYTFARAKRDMEKASVIAQKCLGEAKSLCAEEDEAKLRLLLQEINRYIHPR